MTEVKTEQVTDHQTDLTDRWRDIRQKVEETSKQLKVGLDRGQELQSEMDSFEAYLNDAEGKLDQLKEVYTDEMDSAGNLIRVCIFVFL